MQKIKRFASVVVGTALSAGASSQQFETGTFELLDVGTRPQVISEGQDFELVFAGYNLQRPFDGTVTLEGNSIVVRVRGYSCFSAGTPPYPPNDSPSIVTVPVAGLPAGSYQVAADWGPDCFNDIASLQEEIIVHPNASAVVFNHESPEEGQTVSGVGVIRGWACYPQQQGQIGKVTFSIDGNSEFQFPLPHGSLRMDTAEVCDYPALQPVPTGYGGVVYWPFLGGEGDHTLTVYIDGEEVDVVNFSIAAPPPTSIPEDLGFRKGAAGEYIVDEFLGTDESVVIRWSEADQNFIIVEYN